MEIPPHLCYIWICYLFFSPISQNENLEILISRVYLMKPRQGRRKEWKSEGACSTGWGECAPPLVEIGLIDLPKTRRASAPQPTHLRQPYVGMLLTYFFVTTMIWSWWWLCYGCCYADCRAIYRRIESRRWWRRHCTKMRFDIKSSRQILFL